MIERTTTHFGHLVFDRDAIVRAALRAYVEAIFGCFLIKRLSFPASAEINWTGDVQRGAFYNGNAEGDYDVLGWTEAGVVGFAYQLGFGPIEQLELSVDAVTGGVDDVRGALPGLPDELEPAFVMATRMLSVGPEYGQLDAGVGFWLYGDRVGGTMFDDPMPGGAERLAAWGLLHKGRLLPLASCYPCPGGIVKDQALPQEAPVHAVIDAVTDRALVGPTEFAPDELATLLPTPLDPKLLLDTQRLLQEVGISWPGSPKLPEEPRTRRRDNTVPTPPTTPLHVEPRRLGNLYFDRDAIVRAALRAYIENLLAWLDPQDRHPFAASFVPRWTGDLKRGAFSNGDGRGSYEVMAWTEAGVVGFAYQLGFGPIEQLELSVDAVTGGVDDVRAALPLFPAELLPALEMAVGMLDIGVHGEKLASVGFWLYGEQVAALHFHDPGLGWVGNSRLHAWGRLIEGRLRRWSEGLCLADLGPKKAAPIHALADALSERALVGPTALTTDELAILCPTPPAPERWLRAQRMLQQVGISWPGSP